IPLTFIKLLSERLCNIDKPVEFICEALKPCRVEWLLSD
ncbi:unnamed protein product, partial [Rotaria sp. Silwood2]